MFDNVGVRMKTLASAFLMIVAAVCGFLFLGIIFFVCRLNFSVIQILGIALVLLIVFGVIIFMGYLITMCFYAFGELVDNSRTLVRCFTENNGVAQKRYTRKTVSVKRNVDGSWQCPSCGKANPMGRLWCENCDIEAVFSD